MDSVHYTPACRQQWEPGWHTALVPKHTLWVNTHLSQAETKGADVGQGWGPGEWHPHGGGNWTPLGGSLLVPPEHYRWEN